MTAWVVAQPTRGLLLERSLQRVIGTIVGSMVGVLLILLFAGIPVLLVVGLALWVGLCAYAGNVMRHYRAYGVFLAGYTAAMVALLDLPHPDLVFHLAFERVSTILVGITVSALISGLLVPAAEETELMRRLRRVCGDTVRWTARTLAEAPRGELLKQERLLVAEMAAIEEILDQQAAGSSEGHRRARHIRSLLAALLSLLAGARGVTSRRGGGEVNHWQALFIGHLDQAAMELASPTPVEMPMDEIRAALKIGAVSEALAQALFEVVEALQAISRENTAVHGEMTGRPTMEFLFHRDWIGARAAMLRAVVAVLVVGGVWQVTGWSHGQFMVLSTCVMTTVFSAFENPVVILRQVLLGSMVGAAAAVIFHLLLLPQAANLSDVLLLALPFLFLGGLATAHRRTAVAAMDYNMCFLLLGQPVLPFHGTTADTINSAAAVLLGVSTALLAFRFLLPVSASRRLRALIQTTVRELEGLATSRSQPNPRRWRARLHHRILQLVKWVDSVGDPNLAPVDGGLAALTVGTTIMRLKELQSRPGLPLGPARCLRVALGRLGTMSRHPEAAATALDRAATRLETETDMLREAAAALRMNTAFFAGGR